MSEIDYRKRVADRIRELRATRFDQPISQEAMADRWPHPRLALARLETKRTRLDLELLAELAEAFDMDLSDFLWPVLLGPVEPKEQKERMEAWMDTLEERLRERHAALVEAYVADLDYEVAMRLLKHILFLKRRKPQRVHFVLDLVAAAAHLAVVEEESGSSYMAQADAERALIAATSE